MPFCERIGFETPSPRLRRGEGGGEGPIELSRAARVVRHTSFVIHSGESFFGRSHDWHTAGPP
jgi:hypothetical protein